MEKLIILSDLWGKQNSEWVINYVAILKDYYLITFYDCCELGDIDSTEMTEERRHKQFVKGGIETAVKNLIQKEKGIINVLAFSVGGFIAWKAGQEGLHIKNLTAISATRIRYEMQKPSGNVALIFGALDQFKPDTEWFTKIGLQPHIYKEQKHDCYKKKEIALDVCCKIIKSIALNP